MLQKNLFYIFCISVYFIESLSYQKFVIGKTNASLLLHLPHLSILLTKKDFHSIANTYHKLSRINRQQPVNVNQEREPKILFKSSFLSIHL